MSIAGDEPRGSGWLALAAPGLARLAAVSLLVVMGILVNLAVIPFNLPAKFVGSLSELFEMEGLTDRIWQSNAMALGRQT